MNTVQETILAWRQWVHFGTYSYVCHIVIHWRFMGEFIPSNFHDECVVVKTRSLKNRMPPQLVISLTITHLFGDHADSCYPIYYERAY